jgi:hypothetical protein
MSRFEWVLRDKLDTKVHLYLIFSSTKYLYNKLATVSFILKDTFQESRN